MLFIRDALKEAVRLRVNEWKNINDTNNKHKHKKIGMAVFKSDNIDIRVNSINRD